MEHIQQCVIGINLRTFILFLNCLFHSLILLPGLWCFIWDLALGGSNHLTFLVQGEVTSKFWYYKQNPSSNLLFIGYNSNLLLLGYPSTCDYIRWYYSHHFHHSLTLTPAPSANVGIPSSAMNQKGRGRGQVATAEVGQQHLQRYKELMDNRFGMMEELGMMEEQLHAIMQQLFNLGARRAPTNPREENSNGSDVNPLH